MPRAAIRFAVLLLPLLGLAACTSFLPSAGDLPPRLALDADVESPTIDPALPLSLVIADPDTEAAFNTFNVAVRTAPFQFEFLEGAEWTDRAPVLLRLFVERRFENSGAFRAVGDRTNLPTATYELQTDIRAFHLDWTVAPEIAKVSIGARLVDARGNTIATRIFSAEAAPAGDSQLARITALNAAARSAVDALLNWTVEALRDLPVAGAKGGAAPPR